MTRADREATATRLRKRGLKYREIAEQMGLPQPKDAWRLVNAERDRELTRAYKARNREALREYDREYADQNRATCPSCGYVYGKHSGNKSGGPLTHINFGQCPSCAHERNEQIVVAWNIGLPLREICEWLDWSMGHLSVQMNRLRKAGYDLPYRYKAVEERHRAAA